MITNLNGVYTWVNMPCWAEGKGACMTYLSLQQEGCSWMMPCTNYMNSVYYYYQNQYGHIIVIITIIIHIKLAEDISILNLFKCTQYKETSIYLFR